MVDVLFLLGEGKVFVPVVTLEAISASSVVDVSLGRDGVSVSVSGLSDVGWGGEGGGGEGEGPGEGTRGEQSMEGRHGWGWVGGWMNLRRKSQLRLLTCTTSQTMNNLPPPVSAPAPGNAAPKKTPKVIKRVEGVSVFPVARVQKIIKAGTCFMFVFQTIST